MDIKVQMAAAKDGNEILEVVKDGQSYWLNSTYKPFVEAERFAKKYADMEEDSILLVFGFGNGIFADWIMRVCGKTTKVIFYEPCEEIAKYASGHLDLSSFCDSRNCELVADGVVSGNTGHIHTVPEFPKVLEDIVVYHKRERIHFCVLPKYKELFPEQYSQYNSTIEFHMQLLQSNTQTAKAIGHLAVENNINILKYIPESYCADSFVNLFPENMPVILVSAGPSLEKNIRDLRQAKGRALILCVDTAVNYMLKEDIIPDMIMTIDPRKELVLFDDERIREIPLVGVTDMSKKVLEKVQSRKLILAGTENSYIQKLYREAGHELGQMEGGGSVATTAYSFCRYMGFRFLILVGQDLALTGDQMYAGKQKLSMDTFTREIIEVEDVYGEKTYTTRDYYYYLKWFEQVIRLYPTMQVIDATEGGARITGTRIMSLQEALNEYAGQEYDISGRIESVEPVFKPEEREKFIERLIRDRDSFNNLVVQLERGKTLASQGRKALRMGGQNVLKCNKINAEMIHICDMFENSDASFLIHREIDATNLEHYMEICDKQMVASGVELYELMKEYFDCILTAAKSVKVIYDEVL